MNERYQSARNSKNLKIDANETRDIDHIIAAGMSNKTALCAALNELMSSRKQTDFNRAKELLLLKSNNNSLVTEVLSYWIDPNCVKCRGVKFELQPGTNRLSSKICPSCLGNGKKSIPHGQNGRKLLNLIDAAVVEGSKKRAKLLTAY